MENIIKLNRPYTLNLIKLIWLNSCCLNILYIHVYIDTNTVCVKQNGIISLSISISVLCLGSFGFILIPLFVLVFRQGAAKDMASLPSEIRTFMTASPLHHIKREA